MTMQAHGLSINQRNLFSYFLAHKKRHKHAPCFVPKLPLAGSNLPLYLNALEALEAKGLITVDRSTQHYTGWIMNHAKGVSEETQQGLTASWK
jgi:hypothetical protein